jgi:hypothetical protein
MLRVCLPLTNDRASYDAQHIPHAHSIPHYTSTGLSANMRPGIKVFWVGNLGRSHRLRHTRGKPRPESQPVQLYLPGLKSAVQLSVLRTLQMEHSSLRDGDILILDFAGTRLYWNQSLVAAICHFFLEMNYTSTVGRSSVVLWNVPKLAEGLFDIAIQNANERIAKLKDLRRTAMLVRDDGHARFVCGWPLGERILETLYYQGECDLDELGFSDLSENDRQRFRAVVSENSHLFDWLGKTRVRLRAWSMDLLAAAWDDGIQWLNRVIDLPPGEGGALRQCENALFRLPSTGWLVEQFFSFGGLISNLEACARLAWLLCQLIRSLETRHQKQALFLVCVTRPLASLARHLIENYFADRDLQLIRGNTVEELQYKQSGDNIRGPAILLTDVISSGQLCHNVSQALPGLEWLGTVAILETGNVSNEADTEAEVCISFPIACRRTRHLPTGDVYALTQRQVTRVEPTQTSGKSVIAIDRVNVCPIKPPEPGGEIGESVWPYLERRPQSLQIGHFEGGDLHHYVYYVNARQLIEATHPITESRLLDTIVEAVLAQLESVGYDSDRTVIMHPPRDTSYAEEIAIAVQRSTGALYRYVLHRDVFAGQRRFSSFVEHGVPIRGSTVIIIDDGSNTGETLLGLLHAAASARPATILAHVALSRMPLHKVDLLRRISHLTGVSSRSVVKFALRLSIPVFSARNCPICRFQQSVLHVLEQSALLRRYARMLREETVSAPTGASAVQQPTPFLWRCNDPVETARLREAIEFADYDDSATSYLSSRLKSGAECDLTVLLDLAFAICAEPELLQSAIFLPFLQPLHQALARHLQVAPELELLTLLSFAFHLTVSLKTSHKESPAKLARTVWQSAVGNQRLSISTLGRFFVTCLADVERSSAGEQPARREVAREYGTELITAMKEASTNGQPMLHLLGTLFSREVLGILEGKVEWCVSRQEEEGGSDLFQLASEVASKFFWHASEHVRAHIQALREWAMAPRRPGAWRDISVHVRALVLAFEDLYQLQQRLSHLDPRSLRASGEISGASTYWCAPQLWRAIASFGEVLTDVAEEVEQMQGDVPVRLNLCVNSLREAWSVLYEEVQPALSDIFPRVKEVLHAAWSECEAISGLPSSAISPIDVGGLADHTRCFVPRALLLRFINVAMLNFKTIAYRGWSSEDIAEDAYVRLAVTQDQQVNSVSRLRIQVIDNGPTRGSTAATATAATGSGRGLSDIKLLATPFGSELSGPVISADQTMVELIVLVRSTRG